MESADHLAWTEFYSEFADKLLPFKNDRKALISKILDVYKFSNQKLPKLEADNDITDIDPFTVFGLFNKQISDENRILLIKAIAQEFNVKAKVPTIFEGIPLLNNLNATFYGFKGDRQADDIDNFWDLFEAALNFADRNSPDSRTQFIQSYDKVHDQRYIAWKVTLGLFYIRPFNFISLDSRNRWFMRLPENMPADFIVNTTKLYELVPYGKDYLRIIDDCTHVLQSGKYTYKSFPELSLAAWIESERVNLEKQKKDASKSDSKAYNKWYKPLIQALRDLEGSATPEDARSKIIENEHLSEDELNAKRGKKQVNKFSNEVAFARSDLVLAGYIDNSVRGIWSLTNAGKTVELTEELIREIVHIRTNRSKKTGLDEDKTTHYWLYSPGPAASKWDECYQNGYMLLGFGDIGDFKAFSSKDEIKDQLKKAYGDKNSYKHSAHAIWQFTNEMKTGDIIYVKRGVGEIIGQGEVISDYEYIPRFKDDYQNVRKVKWNFQGSWESPQKSPLKTLTDITSDVNLIEQLQNLIPQKNAVDDAGEDEIEYKYPSYTRDDFLDEVFITADSYHRLVNLLKVKKNVILQGAPGVGKTFIAKRLAYSMMGVKDSSRVQMVQFHQSYSYEDFIMGYRPTDKGFELKKGAFYNFCKKAEIDSDQKYFFIIDEINRGNLSKIFGELFMLIETDKRGQSLQLLYSDELFNVPENVYIIGMMNTADRSLAMLDYALRRRFAFFEIAPGFDSEGFLQYSNGLDNEKFNKLKSAVISLNRAIAEDDNLGEGFCIGHSYFCNLNADEVTTERLSAIVEYELIPLLKEYWFDEPELVRQWTENLRRAIS